MIILDRMLNKARNALENIVRHSAAHMNPDLSPILGWEVAPIYNDETGVVAIYSNNIHSAFEKEPSEGSVRLFNMKNYAVSRIAASLFGVFMVGGVISSSSQSANAAEMQLNPMHNLMVSSKGYSIDNMLDDPATFKISGPDPGPGDDPAYVRSMPHNDRFDVMQIYKHGLDKKYGTGYTVRLVLTENSNIAVSGTVLTSSMKDGYAEGYLEIECKGEKVATESFSVSTNMLYGDCVGCDKTGGGDKKPEPTKPAPQPGPRPVKAPCDTNIVNITNNYYGTPPDEKVRDPAPEDKNPAEEEGPANHVRLKTGASYHVYHLSPGSVNDNQGAYPNVNPTSTVTYPNHTWLEPSKYSPSIDLSLDVDFISFYIKDKSGKSTGKVISVGGNLGGRTQVVRESFNDLGQFEEQTFDNLLGTYVVNTVTGDYDISSKMVDAGLFLRYEGEKGWYAQMTGFVGKGIIKGDYTLTTHMPVTDPNHNQETENTGPVKDFKNTSTLSGFNLALGYQHKVVGFEFDLSSTLFDKTKGDQPAPGHNIDQTCGAGFTIVFDLK